ncbi:MAG: HIT domain-containing protein [bacterium]|nr:HIT domain-containing protein [bacterium]
MNNANCIFCKIVNKELPADIVYDDDKVLAFKDTHPKAALHILIIPKTHIKSINSENSENIVKDLILIVKDIIKRDSISGCKLLFNVGREAGQTVDHLHMHLLNDTPRIH